MPADVLTRRLSQRRQIFAIQAGLYAVTACVLSLYYQAGTIPAWIPVTYAFGGIAFTGLFAALSEAHVNDRFQDHYLTIVQLVGHILIQLGSLAAAPQIGFTFLSTLFVAFGFGSLRLTLRQTLVAWIISASGVSLIVLETTVPLGLPMTSPAERVAAIMVFLLSLGQLAFVGLFGHSLRRQFYRRSVDLKEAYRRIEELAELDELTGAFNRRCILRMLDEEIARAGRSGSPCSVALVDLDWFKRINDAFGHPTGDEVLRAFSITMFANLRAIDRFGRYGGEEFLLVLPDTTADAAARILERLRMIVSELDWSAFSPGMQVTISAGIATLAHNETPDAMLARADRALYAAKDRGRNRVVIA
jgi:diguanylate cyclase (GGDEF)-like protein